MWQNITFNKVLITLEHLGFIALAILAYTYSNERLFADSGYYFIRVINSKWFWIEHNRLILALSQIPVVMGVWVGLSLKKLVVLYSIWHVTFFYLTYLISKFKFSNHSAGFTLLLLLTLGIGLGFFVPMFELYYAAALIVLFSSILQKGKLDTWKLLWLIVVAIFISSAHFFAIILLGIVLLDYLLENGFTPSPNLLLPLLSVIGMLVFKRFHISEYEQGKINWFLEGLAKFSITEKYLSQLSDFFLEHYSNYLILLSVMLGLLVVIRKWKLLAIVIPAVVALTIMVTISDPWFNPTRYQEQVYFPLMFIPAFFLTRYGLTSQKKWIPLCILVLCSCTIIVRAHAINEHSEWFSRRLGEMRSLIDQAQFKDGTKFIVDENTLSFEPNWSYPIESLILSAFESDKSVSVCTDADFNYDSNFDKLEKDMYLFRRWELYETQSLNSSYFKLSEDIYRKLDKP